MGELVPRDYYDPVRAKRKTRKELARMEQEGIKRERALEYATKDAAQQLEANERLAMYRAQTRLDNGFKLAAQTDVNATGLRNLATQLSRGNPSLEAELREVEEVALLGAKTIVYQYMTRP